jgi:hypothetical protein
VRLGLVMGMRVMTPHIVPEVAAFQLRELRRRRLLLSVETRPMLKKTNVMGLIQCRTKPNARPPLIS